SRPRATLCTRLLPRTTRTLPLQRPPPAPLPAAAPPLASLSVIVLPRTVRTVGAPGLVGRVDGLSLKRPPPKPPPPWPPVPPAPPSAWLPVSVLSETVRTAPKVLARPPPRASPPLWPLASRPPMAWFSMIALLPTVVVPGGPKPRVARPLPVA